MSERLRGFKYEVGGVSRLPEGAIGDRVRLIRCTDLHTRLAPGTEGTVSMVDSLGTVHVRWDDGSRLGLVPGEDAWTVVRRHRPD